MKTNCKKWKYLLCITAVMTAFSSIPFNTQAADQQVRLMNDLDKKQQTTSSKMNSAQDRNVFAVTAGAANILDAEIVSTDLPDEAVPKMITPRTNVSSTKKKSDALAAFVKALMVLQPEILPQSNLVMAKVNEYVNIRQEADQDAEKVGVLYKDCGGDILEKNKALGYDVVVDCKDINLNNYKLLANLPREFFYWISISDDFSNVNLGGIILC